MKQERVVLPFSLGGKMLAVIGIIIASSVKDEVVKMSGDKEW